MEAFGGLLMKQAIGFCRGGVGWGVQGLSKGLDGELVVRALALAVFVGRACLLGISEADLGKVECDLPYQLT